MTLGDISPRVSANSSLTCSGVATAAGLIDAERIEHLETFGQLGEADPRDAPGALYRRGRLQPALEEKSFRHRLEEPLIGQVLQRARGIASLCGTAKLLRSTA